MKIEDGSKKNKKSLSDGFTFNKFKEFCKDKKTRWMIIAFVVMVIVMIVQFILPHVIGK